MPYDERSVTDVEGLSEAIRALQQDTYHDIATLRKAVHKAIRTLPVQVFSCDKVDDSVELVLDAYGGRLLSYQLPIPAQTGW